MSLSPSSAASWTQSTRERVPHCVRCGASRFGGPRDSPAHRRQAHSRLVEPPGQEQARASMRRRPTRLQVLSPSRSTGSHSIMQHRSRVGAMAAAAMVAVVDLAALQHQRRRGTSTVDLAGCRSRVGALVAAAVAVVAGLAALQHQRRRGTSMVGSVGCRSRVGALVAAVAVVAAPLRT